MNVKAVQFTTDGKNQTFRCHHGFMQINVIAQLWDEKNEVVNAAISKDENNIYITFGNIPAVGEKYTVIVIG